MSEVISTVEYRPIQGFQGYYIGNDGSVWSTRIMRGYIDGVIAAGPWKRCSLHRRPYGNRYAMVCLRAIPGGRVSCRYVHRLVLEAFVGPCPEGMECRHFPDRDTANNHLGNVSWGTRQQNMADKKIHGTSPDTHCRRGHEFTQTNAHFRPNGQRRCRTCDRDGQRRRSILAAQAVGLVPRSRT